MGKNKKKKKDKKKGGLFGLFGGKSEAPATPAPINDDVEMTMAPEYSPQAGQDMTMVPEYMQEMSKSGTGHVAFGPGAEGQKPGDMTMAPGYAAGGVQPADPFNFDAPPPVAGGPAPGEMTMAPGYAAGGPQPAAGGAIQPADPFNFDAPPGPALGGPAPGEMTMAPGYAAGGQPPADPFNFDAPPGPALGGPAPGEMTMAPGYVVGGPPPAAGGPAPGEMTMAPGYAAGGQPPADPFNFDTPLGGPAPGEMTMAPGYAAGGAAGPAGQPPLDPYNPGAGAEMTLAPGYVMGDLQRPAPNTGFADEGDMTMAPNYGAPVGGPAPSALPDPFADADLTLEPNYQAQNPLPDPFADVPAGSDMTLAPGYAQPGSGTGGVIDPFNFDVEDGRAPTAAPPVGVPSAAPPLPGQPAPLPSQPGPAPTPFGYDAQNPFTSPTLKEGSPPDPFGATTVKQHDPFDFDAPTVVPAGGAAAFPSSDPFGPPLLDDPGAVADPFALDPLGGPPDERAEKTILDVGHDASGTEELEISDLDALAPLPTAAPLPGAPVAAPLPMPHGVPAVPSAYAATPAARPLFGASRPEAGAIAYANPAPEVVVDAERRLVFAPAVPGGWSGVPASFRVLSDGAVVGRVSSVANSVVRVEASPSVERASAKDGRVKLPPMPEGVKVDRQSGAVLVPSELETRMPWLPADVCRTEEGISFLLPKDAEFEDDGTWSVPSHLCAPRAAHGSTAGPHGKVVASLNYLGLVERTHADGWTCLEISSDAEPTGDGRLLLPASARSGPGSPPALLRTSVEPDGRLALHLPAGTQQRTDGLWFAPPLAPACEDSVVLADHDAASRDERSYLGIQDTLLADDWIRLELPAGARVEDGALVLPNEYAALGDPRVRGAFDRLADGSLSFKLPEGAEVLGSRVLIPPPGTAVPSAPPPSKTTASSSTNTKGKGKGKSKGKKLSGLDRFRGSKASNDEVSFDGVLKPDDATSSEAKPEAKPEATEPEATEPEATEPEAAEPEAAEPETAEPEAAEPEGAGAENEEATESDATEDTDQNDDDDDDAAASKTSKRKRRKRKKK